MKKKLNVAVIGLGVGSRHAEIFSQNKYCNLKTLCDFNHKNLKIESSKFNNVKMTNNSDEIFEDKSIDLVSIASYDEYHFQQIMLCIKTGKNFFVEKPFCTTELELKKIKKCLDSKKKSCLFSSNFVLRGNSTFQNIKKIISKTNSGSIFYIEGDYNYGRLNKITSGWRSKSPNYSINLGGSIHLVDLFNWITQNKIIRVLALGNKISTKSSKFNSNDFSSAIIEFNDGSIGKINANFGCVIPHHHILNIYSTNLTIKHNLENSVLYQSRSKNIKPKLLDKKGYDKAYVLNSFISSIVNKKKPEVTPKEIFDTMSVCFALDKSLKSQKWEKIQYL